MMWWWYFFYSERNFFSTSYKYKHKNTFLFHWKKNMIHQGLHTWGGCWRIFDFQNILRNKMDYKQWKILCYVLVIKKMMFLILQKNEVMFCGWWNLKHFENFTEFTIQIWSTWTLKLHTHWNVSLFLEKKHFLLSYWSWKPC